MIIFIDDEEQLSSLVVDVEAATNQNISIALDTEFERRTTFYPKPALLQFHIVDKTYLLDPVKFTKLDALFEALSHVTIIMHACREDLEVFRMLSNTRLNKFFDTQVAAAFLGYHPQISYQNIVSFLLDIEVDKSETCSDWLLRPLSQDQINYAAADVIHLGEVNDKLLEKLIETDRLNWYHQEMSFLYDLTEEAEAKDYIFKMKGLSRLNDAQLQAAYEILVWRDELARLKDIPRGFIIKDKGLLQILKAIGTMTISFTNLQNIDDVPLPFLKRYSKKIIEIINNPKPSEESSLAIEKIKRDLPSSSKSIKKQLKAFRNDEATKLNVQAEFLLSNRLLESALEILFFDLKANSTASDIENIFSQSLKPWRYSIFKTPLLDALSNIHK